VAVRARVAPNLYPKRMFLALLPHCPTRRPTPVFHFALRLSTLRLLPPFPAFNLMLLMLLTQLIPLNLSLLPVATRITQAARIPTTEPLMVPCMKPCAEYLTYCWRGSDTRINHVLVCVRISQLTCILFWILSAIVRRDGAGREYLPYCRRGAYT
jgi:hypothetical protein